MRLRIVPASTGLVWVKEGLRLFWRRPMALASLFVFGLVTMSLLARIPLVGTVLALTLLPCMTLAMMVGSGEAMQGRQPSLRLLFTAFEAGPQRMRALLTLGALYAVLFLSVLGLSALIDGGTFARMYLGGESTEGVPPSTYQQGMLFSMALYLPLSLLFWHAPGLVYWHGVPPLKSLFFSVVACLRNIGAFMLYWVGWVVVFIAGGLALAIITGILGVFGAMSVALATVVMLLMSMTLASMFFVSIVFTFRDCFDAPVAAQRYAEHAAMAQHPVEPLEGDEAGVVDARRQPQHPSHSPSAEAAADQESHAQTPAPSQVPAPPASDAPAPQPPAPPPTGH